MTRTRWLNWFKWIGLPSQTAASPVIRLAGLIPGVVLAIALGAATDGRADFVYGLRNQSTGFNPVANANGDFATVTASTTYSSTLNTTLVDLIVSATQSGASIDSFGFNTTLTASKIALYQGTSNTGLPITFKLKTNQNISSAGIFSYELGGPFNSNTYNPVLVEFTVSGNQALGNILGGTSNANLFAAHLKPANGAATGFVYGGTPETQSNPVPTPPSVVLALSGFLSFGLVLGVRRLRPWPA